MRVLVTGWASFLHGEATAGDVASLCRVAKRLATDGIDHSVVLSPEFAPGATHFADADPDEYSHVLFCCGPVHGWQLEELHRRYATCARLAVGVSVLDPHSRAAKGFHRILPRDGPGLRASPDLATGTRERGVPVVGAVFAPTQPEYGDRTRHHETHEILRGWLAALDAARVPLDTRLARGDWRLCSTPEAFASLVARTDVLVTTRLHGLVFALSAGVPPLAVDPVSGGGKVTAQARAQDWPAVIGAEELAEAELDRWWRWCRSDEGVARAAAACRLAGTDSSLLDALPHHLNAAALDRGRPGG